MFWAMMDLFFFIRTLYCVNSVVSESTDLAVSAQISLTENARKKISQYWSHCFSLWGEVQKYPSQWMFIAKRYQLSLLFFLSVVPPVESKMDLIFAEGVLDDLWMRNTGGSVCVQLISGTETDTAAKVKKLQHTVTFVSITQTVYKDGHRHFLSLYKNETKISRIWALPSCADDIIWSQSLRSSDWWWSSGIGP